MAVQIMNDLIFISTPHVYFIHFENERIIAQVN